MYDAKKDENPSSKQLQYNCIGDRSYYYTCKHSNMIDVRVSYVPIETIIKEFK